LPQLGPANQNLTLEIQNEAALEQERKVLQADGNRKGRQKGHSPSGPDLKTRTTMTMTTMRWASTVSKLHSIVIFIRDKIVFLMPQVESTTVLKDKLHAP